MHSKLRTACAYLPGIAFTPRPKNNQLVRFNPWVSVANSVQYDSVSRVLGWQSRFRWILRPGNDIYFVYTHNWLNDLNGHRSTLDRSAATKIVYTHRF
jgi:hypothetical protein